MYTIFTSEQTKAPPHRQYYHLERTIKTSHEVYICIDIDANRYQGCNKTLHVAHTMFLQCLSLVGDNNISTCINTRYPTLSALIESCPTDNDLSLMGGFCMQLGHLSIKFSIPDFELNITLYAPITMQINDFQKI